MQFGRYHEVTVTLSSATFSRLERGNPFNKRRVAEQAIETIRVAVYSMYPPRTPEEWKDKSRYEGVGRLVLLYFYDLFGYSLRRLLGRDEAVNHVSDEPAQITLQIPIGLLHWIEKIARSNQSSIPEATLYAIEHGLRVLDSQSGGAEGLRKVWSDIVDAIRKRLIKVDRV
jgi:hypothetical protein